MMASAASADRIVTPDVFLRELFLVPEYDAQDGRLVSYHDKVDRLYLAMLKGRTCELDVKYTFTDGLVAKQATAPAKTLLISKTHLVENQFIMSKGVCYTVEDNGTVVRAEAPCSGVTKPGSRKVVYVDEETVLTSIHPNPTNETDLKKLEAMFYAEDRLAISDHPDHVDFLLMADQLGVTPEQIRIESHNPDTLGPFPPGMGDLVQVRASAIEGMGLFAAQDIPEFALIAPASIAGLRTPAGRFTNHARSPNAMLHVQEKGVINLVSIDPISAGTEITLDYRQARAAAIESLLLNKS